MGDQQGFQKALAFACMRFKKTPVQRASYACGYADAASVLMALATQAGTTPEAKYRAEGLNAAALVLGSMAEKIGLAQDVMFGVPQEMAPPADELEEMADAIFGKLAGKEKPKIQ